MEAFSRPYYGGWQRASEWGERIPIGIFYRIQDVPTYEDQVPALKAGSLVKRPLAELQPAQAEELLAEAM